MSNKRDYYEVLGISKASSDSDIKRAFRSQARRYHPDKNPEDDAAEQAFKEVQEAYAVLSNEEQRRQYDMFGHDRPGGSPFGPSGFEGVNISLDDLFGGGFESIFSQMFGGGRSRRRRVRRGSDVLVRHRVTLKQVFDQDELDINLVLTESCEECGGSGAATPEDVMTCETCDGHGRITQQARVGPFVQQVINDCRRCSGLGSTIANPCKACKGDGREQNERTVRLSIPTGADSGTRLRMRGRGEPAKRGGVSGDLFVELHVDSHEWFERDGSELLMALPLGYPELMLGTTVSLPHFDGKPLEINIPAGSRPGDTISVKNRGLQKRRGRGRGSVTVLLKMYTPSKVSKSMKATLESLQNEFGLGADEIEDAVRKETNERRR